MTETPSIIEINGLVKIFEFLPVLKQMTLSIPRGQFVALLGANGSGKSTLLRLIAGLTKPSSGKILVGGWQIPDEAEQVRADRKSTRLNSSHSQISYAVFCLKKKKKQENKKQQHY